MDNPIDQVLQDLKKLRAGQGLTARRIAGAATLREALGGDTPEEAVESLQRLVQQLPDGDRTRALKVDLGLDLDVLLGRAPSTREIDLLGERRQTYASLVKKDVKTLGRWSDKALQDLRTHLDSGSFAGVVLVTAGVQDGRLAGIEVLRYRSDDAERSTGSTVSWRNPADGPSLPAVLFGLPAEWTTESLTFVVSFLDRQPDQVWALAADTLSDVCFGHERFPIVVEDKLARCRIEHPRNDQVYGVCWT